VRLYTDVNVRIEITQGLRDRGVDLLTAQEDGAVELPDPKLLDRSTALGRVLFSHDRDLLTESAARQAHGRPFAGVIYARQLGVTIRACIEDLELIAKACEPNEMFNNVLYLPLR
jgi:predicted nuclease of predicted toxin-antitoxin system